jgi:UDP-N-acetylglucosamine acyltransferase
VADDTARIEVDPTARLIGDVALAAPSSVGAGAVLQGPLRAGPGLQVQPMALLGGPAQHRGGGDGRLVLGADVQIWEAATLHRGSAAGSGTTTIGDRVMLMAYAHVGHDAVLEDDVVLANGVQLGGHVRVGAGAVLGARAAVHQFTRIGRGSMVAAGAMVAGDVPPWTMVAGDRARILGPNRVALPSREAIDGVRRALRLLLRSAPDTEQVRAEMGHLAEVRDLLAFVAAPSRRPLCGRGRRS